MNRTKLVQIGAYIAVVVLAVLLVYNIRTDADRDRASYCQGQQERLDLFRDLIIYGTSAPPLNPAQPEAVERAVQFREYALARLDAADTCP